MSLHPSLDLGKLYLGASHVKDKLALVGLGKPPLLVLSYDSSHLVWLNLLVLSPLSDAQSVLPFSAEYRVSNMSLI
jgi:hypothetical protein